MTFLFSQVCDLLDRLDYIFSRDPPYLPKDAEQKARDVVLHWFKKHWRLIRHDTDGLALLSVLFPEKRRDIMYELNCNTLEKIISRALSLSTSRVIDLVHWRESGVGMSDLGDCVERVQNQVAAERGIRQRASRVTIEEIERVLRAIASQTNQNRVSPLDDSSLALEQSRDAPTELLGKLYRRFQAQESKWFTRLILKSYSPVIIPERLVYMLYHPFLADLLGVEPDFSAALFFLRGLNLPASNYREDVSPAKLVRASLHC